MFESQCIVDWLSFTLPSLDFSSIPTREFLSRHLSWVVHCVGESFPRGLFGFGWEQCKGRPPYGLRFYSPDAGVNVFADVGLPHVLVELSGLGCRTVRDMGAEVDLLRAVKANVTRLDLAVDILDGPDPDDFVAESGPNDFSVSATFDSRTGKTCYIGSMRSDRFARVYRYREPLPRSGVTRVEHVFRNEWARSLCGVILKDGLGAAAEYCGSTWGWRHEAWPGDGISEGVTVTRELSCRKPDTVLWLQTQVFPAMRRLAREGVIFDLRAFTCRYLFEIAPCVESCLECCAGLRRGCAEGLAACLESDRV